MGLQDPGDSSTRQATPSTTAKWRGGAFSQRLYFTPVLHTPSTQVDNRVPGLDAHCSIGLWSCSPSVITHAVAVVVVAVERCRLCRRCTARPLAAASCGRCQGPSCVVRRCPATPGRRRGGRTAAPAPPLSAWPRPRTGLTRASPGVCSTSEGWGRAACGPCICAGHNPGPWRGGGKGAGGARARAGRRQLPRAGAPRLQASDAQGQRGGAGGEVG